MWNPWTPARAGPRQFTSFTLHCIKIHLLLRYLCRCISPDPSFFEMVFYYIVQTDLTPGLKLSYFILPSAGIAGCVATYNFPLTLYLIFHVLLRPLVISMCPYQFKDSVREEAGICWKAEYSKHVKKKQNKVSYTY